MGGISILGWTIPLKHWYEVQLTGHHKVLLALLLQIIPISAAAPDLNVFLIMCPVVLKLKTFIMDSGLI